MEDAETRDGEIPVRFNNKQRYKHIKKMYSKWFAGWFMREMVKRVEERMMNEILYGTEKNL